MRLKAEHLVKRYNILTRSTHIRSEIPKGVGDYSQRMLIKDLTGNEVRNVAVLGYLVQTKLRCYHLLDPTGAVKLSLTPFPTFDDAFFCEGMFVLIEGDFVAEELLVKYVRMPPAELTKRTVSYPSEPRETILLKQHCNVPGDGKFGMSIYFIQDIHFDERRTLKQFRILLKQLDNCPPLAIVMVGPYTNRYADDHRLGVLMDKLSAIAADCINLRLHTHLIIVPCEQFQMLRCLPIPPLPQSSVAILRQNWPHMVTATNPCRLKYDNQEIVVCGLNIVTTLLIKKLNCMDPVDCTKALARTIVSQGHLLPFIDSSFIIPRELENEFSLCPSPDVIFYAQLLPHYKTEFRGCIVTNPGSYNSDNFAYDIYCTLTRKVTHCTGSTETD